MSSSLDHTRCRQPPHYEKEKEKESRHRRLERNGVIGRRKKKEEAVQVMTNPTGGQDKCKLKKKKTLVRGVYPTTAGGGKGSKVYEREGTSFRRTSAAPFLR